MNELIERVQEALDNNWAVEANDIKTLIILFEHYKEERDKWIEQSEEWKSLYYKQQKFYYELLNWYTKK